MQGLAGQSLAGVNLAIYGECPLLRSFDRLTLATPAAGSQNFEIADYNESSVADDNGRPCAIKNVRVGNDANFGTADDGVAVLFGFDLSALFSDAARACVLGKVLSESVANKGMAITLANAPVCVNSDPDVGAPVVDARFGFQLSQASPNPFTKNTTINFSIASKGPVSVEVYNILGQKVRTLVDEIMEPNAYSRDWDGRDDAGARVSNGIYFYKMVSGDFSDTKKAVLLR
jgi:hypothetical protein